MEFRIQRAVQAQHQEITELVQKVWDGLAEKEWFVADGPDYTFRTLTEGKGLGYMALEADTGILAGVFLVTFPGTDPENLGYDAGLAEEELSFAAHMDSAAILPEYRGNGLQYRLMQQAEKDLKAMGFQYLLCTVHPQNRFSRNNVLRQGYQVVATKEKYGGYIRDILMKRIG